MEKGYLVLENGMVFEGVRIGAACPEAMGELVFTTGMVGYLETLTDPCYEGQIVVQTFPLIGNYGTIEADLESPCAPKGYIVRECCDTPSNFRCQYPLDAYLKRRGIPGLQGVDTREVTRVLRAHGTMRAMIADEIPSDLTALRNMPYPRAFEGAAGSTATVSPAVNETRFHVGVVDYGATASLIRQLNERGCTVTRVPHHTTAEALLAMSLDGIVLSEGPGNPMDNAFEIEQIRALMGRVPLMGIGLGHQMMALAVGGCTRKMPFGHRGANQPVHDTRTHRTYITSQNHGYEVVAESMTGIGTIRYVNANDGSCEGIDYPDQHAFSLQFQPDAWAGPENAEFVLERFMTEMGGDRGAAH